MPLTELKAGDLIGIFYPKSQTEGVLYFEKMGKLPMILPIDDPQMQPVCSFRKTRDNVFINLSECGTNVKAAALSITIV